MNRKREPSNDKPPLTAEKIRELVNESRNSELPMTREQILESIAWLAAEGLIYDSGERRDGAIVWRTTPGKEKEIEAFLQGKDEGEG